MTMLAKYPHQKIEAKWRQVWAKAGLDQTDLRGAGKPFYNLMMFPYPSAEGLHVGNVYAFTGSDIYGRFKRMQGYQVFEPIGLDGFGIHSENYALKIGKHPADQAKISEKYFYQQLHQIGCMFDWSRTLETYDPAYYRWTQWLFVQMFKHGLAYRGKAEVNWCPSCKTVLADEQVLPAGRQVLMGTCERCGNKVERKLLEQWFFKITAYAGKLLENIFRLQTAASGRGLDWSEKVLTAQKNWIGKKEGINITYPVYNNQDERVGEVTCFTTRPDTNFGATFVVLAPEHPLVKILLKSPQLPKHLKQPILHYLEATAKKSKTERIVEGRQKTGVFTGFCCLNQLNHYKMPLYISDFVLMDFGTGAVVGVPGHDKRDFEFAQEMRLPVIRVVVGSDNDKSPITKIAQVQESEGKIVNSDFLNGLDIHRATQKMMDYLEKKGWGKRVTTYHLRDWLISRQRYWGPPIPMIYCAKCAKEGKSWFTLKGEKAPLGPARNASHSDAGGWYPVPEDQLPVLLPYIKDYKPGDDGIAPLAKHKEFYETTCPGCSGKAVRETDVSDTFLDSSWYFLKYPSLGIAEVANRNLDPSSGNSSRGTSYSSRLKSEAGLNFVGSPQCFLAPNSKLKIPWDPEITRRWLPVAMYTGGAEHSVLHLMYSRFVCLALHDWGYLDFAEPFTKFYAHGLVIKDGAKMSKSKGNIVIPDEYIKLYSADALRLYLMFMGPFDQGGDFRDTGMEGMARWVGRIWRMALASLSSDLSTLGTPGDLSQVRKALHRLVKKVTEDTEKRRYNTAIAAMMEFTNLVADHGGVLLPELLQTFLLLLAPYAPYLAEELFQRLVGAGIPSQRRETSAPQAHRSIHLQPWPAYDPQMLEQELVEIVVQVNGKLRGTVAVSPELSAVREEVEGLARKSETVAKYLKDSTVKKTVFIPGKLINFVV